jgi:hypothetical protein
MFLKGVYMKTTRMIIVLTVMKDLLISEQIGFYEEDEVYKYVEENFNLKCTSPDEVEELSLEKLSNIELKVRPLELYYTNFNDEDYINKVVNRTVAMKLIDNIEWDNWSDDNGYFEIESILFNKLAYLASTQEEDDENVLEDVKSYFIATGQVFKDEFNIEDLAEYFSQVSIKSSSYLFEDYIKEL